MTNLPANAARYPWRGNDYWNVGFGWWLPYWVGDSMYYGWAYPPTGYYYPSLPEDYSTIVTGDNTYYESDGVYYQEGEKDGQKGYVVVEAPESSSTDEGQNPFTILKGMCDYLAGLDKFSAVAQTTNDRLTTTGEKVQVSARRMIYLSRPDRVRVDVKDDNGERRVVYDGKTVSMLDRTKNAYTVLQVPETIDGALDALARDYRIVVPLEDLMYKDLFARINNRVTAGQFLGLHAVNGVDCNHLAFSTDNSSWELWVDSGEKPVPRRITIDYGRDEERSRYSADIVAWIASPEYTASTFEFKLPAGATRFEIAANRAE